MVYIWGPDLYCKSTNYYQNIQNRVRISRQNSIFFYNIFLNKHNSQAAGICYCGFGSNSKSARLPESTIVFEISPH